MLAGMKTIITVSTLLLGLTAPAFAVAPSPLRIAIIQEWGSFNAVNNQLASTEALLPLTVRRFTKRSVDGAVLPDLVEAVPRLADRKAKWVIRKNASWGDGVPVTCADFELGWRVGSSDKVTVNAREDYTKIEAVTWDEKDPKSCLVTYKENSWLYDRDLPWPLPKHLEEAVFAANKEKSEGYDRSSLYVTAPATKGLYSGPYVVTELKIGSHIILTRNEHFYGKKPAIEKIVIQHISDTSTLKANLTTGKIDAISAVGFPPDVAIGMDDEFERAKAPHRVRFQTSSIFQGIFFNHENAILKDERVREALSRAIDKEQLTQAFFRGKMPPAENMLSPKHAAFKQRPRSYDRARARKLLDDAGWKPGPDGIRAKDGKKLSFVFKTSAGIKVLENLQVFACGQLKDIGVECVIKNEPPRVLLGTSVVRGDFDFAMYGHPVMPDQSMTGTFATSAIPTAANSWAGGNNMRISWKELDPLLRKFDLEPDKKRRDKIVGDIEKLLLDRYAFIPLYHRSEAIVMPRGLEGLSESFEGTGFNDPEEWR